MDVWVAEKIAERVEFIFQCVVPELTIENQEKVILGSEVDIVLDYGWIGADKIESIRASISLRHRLNDFKRQLHGAARIGGGILLSLGLQFRKQGFLVIFAKNSHVR